MIRYDSMRVAPGDYFKDRFRAAQEDIRKLNQAQVGPSCQDAKMTRRCGFFFCTTLKSLHVQTLCRPLATYIILHTMVWCVNVCPSVFAVQCASHFVFFLQILFRWVYADIPVLPQRERNVGSCAGRCLKSQHVVWCLHCQYFIVHC